jgi:hypothetical protein
MAAQDNTSCPGQLIDGMENLIPAVFWQHLKE